MNCSVLNNSRYDSVMDHHFVGVQVDTLINADGTKRIC
jgi:hypothetical protein